MIVVLVIVALGFAVLAVVGWLVAVIIHRIDEARIGRILAAYDALVVIADKDHARALEMDGRLRLMADEAQVTISDLEVQIVERDAVIARQRKQLSEIVYEIKPNIVVDVATDPPKEVVYEVKTPKRPTRKKAAGSETTA